jgi:hypothetical protein
MKYLKILIDLRLWHLIPYKMPMEEFEAKNNKVKFTEFGFLCFKLIIIWK